jgi:asparagine synthase (glutamine-hydrolysing)
MCGIAGIVLRQKSIPSPSIGKRVKAMTDTLRHRGPDDEGIFLAQDGVVALGNRRLAIRDLSPAGHMPMGNGEGTVWITYNGEIYNTGEIRPELERLGYHFDSASDTEVILHGYETWGAGVLERLRGMFAFAILDTRHSANSPHLFLARDRLGVKPLYYARTSEAFIFASEIKGLVASGLVSREISPAGLVGYLMMGAVPNPLTIYRDVHALEPGCTLTLSLNELHAAPRPVRYWSLPTDEVKPSSEDDAVEQVRALLEESVRIQLVSDVPLGAFLSGGLDSGAVVALMRKATDGPIRTCSMIFEEAEYSEAPYARAMAEAAGAEHYERVITAGDIVDNLDHVLWAMDQPSVDGVNTYFVSKTAHEAGLTVALSGLGGDELFGGYPNTFQEAPHILRLLQLAHVVPGGSMLARSVLGVLPDRQRWIRVQDALARPVSPASAYVSRRGLFAPSEVAKLVVPEILEEASRTFDIVRHVAERADSGARHARFARQSFAWTSRAELQTYTHHLLLRDTDAMSMAHSLEVRVPFLDHRLVETVLRMPSSIKMRGGGIKPLLTRAVGDQLAKTVLARRDKQGFVFPFDAWLRGPLRKRSEEWRQGENMFFRPGSMDELARAFQARNVHWSRLWALTVFQGWMHETSASTNL